jgi:hypothetical protein
LHRFVEAIDGLLGLEDVEDQESTLGLGGGVNDEPVKREVRAGLQSSLAAG